MSAGGMVVHWFNRQSCRALWECGCALLQVLGVRFPLMPVTHDIRLVAHDVRLRLWPLSKGL